MSNVEDLRALIAAEAPLDEPHEPDPGVAAILERVSRAITGAEGRDGRETTSGGRPCPGADETR